MSCNRYFYPFMKSFSLTLSALILIAIPSFAQMGQFEYNSDFRSVRYNDVASMGNKPADVTYRDVTGRYLWKLDWNPAVIIMKANNGIKLRDVRINLYSNEIHYLSGTNEMAAGIDNVKTVVLFSNEKSDSTKVVGVFDVLPNASKKNVFYEVLNPGKIQLLRRVTVIMKKERYDPSKGRDEYHFDGTPNYFIRDGALKPINGVSKSSVLDVISITPEDEKWLDEHKNKLKKPDDVAEFFVYLNGKNK